MAEVRSYTLEYPELVEILIKKLDLHEGLWGIYLEFGFGAANMPTAPDGKAFVPGAVSLVNKIGIQRFESPNNLTVDAAVVNPKPTQARDGQKKSRPR
jgi:hypothetical protein